jgi:hypothetical protein
MLAEARGVYARVIKRLLGTPSRFLKEEILCYAFAQKLTIPGNSVPDSS